MEEEPRKRSPRSPVIPLREALNRALAIHEKEGRQPVPADVAAQDMGYKDANNGRARRTIAALKQFGLIITPREGYVAVSRQVETYKFAPDDPTKRAMLLEFFRAPSTYKTLITKFPDRLPSDAALKYEFIQLGFLPAGADDEVKNFRQSAEYSGAYNASGAAAIEPVRNDESEEADESGQADELNSGDEALDRTALEARHIADRIPIRLAGGRKAVLEIPAPFYEADKRMIKAQVDLILADDVVEGNA